jgi:hypothetical protein
MDDLKPCPFCGAIAEAEQDVDGRWFVCCPVCGAEQCHWLHRNDAESEWNLRAPLTVDEALTVPEVRALHEAAELAYTRLDNGPDASWLDGDELAIRSALVPFRAAMEAKK